MITNMFGLVDITKTIMSATSSALRISDAFILASDSFAASNISVSTKPGLMLCVQSEQIINIFALYRAKSCQAQNRNQTLTISKIVLFLLFFSYKNNFNKNY